MSADGPGSPPVLRSFNDDEKKRLLREFNQRKAIYQQILPPEQQGGMDQGLMGHVSHLNYMKDEGIAAAILIEYIIDIFMLLCSSMFLTQQGQFARAHEQGIAFEPNAAGNWPKIFNLDDKGNPDFDNEFVYLPPDNLPPRDLIRRNGYVPQASYKESLEMQYSHFKNAMYGSGWLSDKEKSLLFNQAFEGASNRASKMDEGQAMRDQQLLNQRAQAERDAAAKRLKR